jgi:hypothetical protein
MSEANVETSARHYEINARSWAECGVPMRGGQLRQAAEALLCSSVMRQVGDEALRESHTRERFMHVPAPGFAGE